MRSIRHFICLAMLALIFPIACEDEVGGGGGTGEPTGPPVAFELYCDRFAEIVCDAALACDCIDHNSHDECLFFVRATECEDDVEEPVNEGRVSFDQVQAGWCLAGLRIILADCSLDDDRWPQACDRLLIGIVAEGDECDDDDECTAGLDCHHDKCSRLPGQGDQCGGEDQICASDLNCADDSTCHPYGKTNDPCGDGVYCDDDLYCDPRTNSCQPMLTVGTDCGHDEYACDDDLYCSPSTGKCAAYPSSGGDCQDSGGDCDDDLYCGSEGTCLPQQPSGTDCTDDEQCLSWECEEAKCTADDDDDFCPF